MLLFIVLLFYVQYCVYIKLLTLGHTKITNKQNQTFRLNNRMNDNAFNNEQIHLIDSLLYENFSFQIISQVTACHCKVNKTYRHFTPKKLIPHFGRRTAPMQATDRHWLSGKTLIQNDPGNSYCTNNLHYNNSTFTNNDRISRPLPPINLDSEMYYTVDFSDSQNSPLIQ